MLPTAGLQMNRGVVFLLEMIGQENIEEFAGLAKKFLVEVQSLEIVKLDSLIILPVQLNRFNVRTQLRCFQLYCFALICLRNFHMSISLYLKLFHYLVF